MNWKKVTKFAESELSSRSRFIRIMTLRGLAAYEHDLTAKV
jgi:hypothetical protein